MFCATLVVSGQCLLVCGGLMQEFKQAWNWPASDGRIAARRWSTTMARFHSCTVAVRRQSGALQPNQPIALMGRGRLPYRNSYRSPGKPKNLLLEVSRLAGSVEEESHRDLDKLQFLLCLND
jgi:hypothetical protein